MNAGSAALLTLLDTLGYILAALEWMILVWVILSWILYFVSQSSLRWKHKQAFSILTQLNDFFTRLTHPILKPFRRLLPAYKTAGIDWSPMLLLLCIWMIRTFLGYLQLPMRR